MGKIERCCGAICYREGGGPHWGDVVMIDEVDGEALHSCEAHINIDTTGHYDPPWEGCDTIRDDDEQQKVVELVEAGHTERCGYRIVDGDGRCECKVKRMPLATGGGR